MNKNQIKVILIYLLGMMLIALGINMILRSGLGAGAWDTLVYSLKHLVGTITLGTSMFIINLVILAFVIIANKSFKYLFILAPISVMSFAIDFWDIVVFGDFSPNTFLIKGLLFLLGAMILTLGLGMAIVTKFPAMIIDELTFSIMKVFKIKSFFKTRVIIELAAILLALFLGLWAEIGLGAINYGSLFLAFVIGPMIALQVHWLTKVFSFCFSKDDKNVCSE